MKSIIFSDESVRAILEGKKTQTRRVIKLPRWSTGDWDDFELDDNDVPFVIGKLSGCLCEIRCPYGKPGEILRVKEVWKKSILSDEILYRADFDDCLKGIPKWKFPLFMPAWASRLYIELTNVRVERVQDISEEDAIAEGVPPWKPKTKEIEQFMQRPSYRNSYHELWDKLNAKRGYPWSLNPWVWVPEFKVVDHVKH